MRHLKAELILAILLGMAVVSVMLIYAGMYL